jgi:hypothetical protein
MQNEKAWHPIRDGITVTDVLKMAALLISVVTGLIGTIVFVSCLPGHSHRWP